VARELGYLQMADFMAMYSEIPLDYLGKWAGLVNKLRKSKEGSNKEFKAGVYFPYEMTSSYRRFHTDGIYTRATPANYVGIANG
jgi:hypothetical protein